VNGDTITVAYGNYVVTSAFGVASPRLICQKNITIEWATPGLMPSFDYSAVAQGDTNVGGSGTAIEMGTACISLTVRGIQIIGKQIPSAPACAFVNVISGYPGNVTPYTLLLEYCSLLQWTNGILTGPNVGGQVTLRYCLIENCMAGDGLSHGIYVSDINTLTVEGCTFRTTPGGVGGDVGHLFKTRAKSAHGALVDLPRHGRVLALHGHQQRRHPHHHRLLPAQVRRWAGQPMYPLRRRAAAGPAHVHQ
jgi:hypothetical protein